MAIAPSMFTRYLLSIPFCIDTTGLFGLTVVPDAAPIVHTLDKRMPNRIPWLAVKASIHLLLILFFLNLLNLSMMRRQLKPAAERSVTQPVTETVSKCGQDKRRIIAF